MLKRIVTAAIAAVLALAASAPAVHAQKALVYCPVGIDATGCDRIVTALQPKFTDGVDRGYDGSNGTVDLTNVDLHHYGVFVVPSLADDATKQPYALLHAVAPRLHFAVTGRVAVYSGAPDQGSSNRGDKDALIQNLATWAANGHSRATGLVGLVAFLDLSEHTAERYSWVRDISLTDVSADAQLTAFSDVQAVSARGTSVLSAGGRSVRFSNMASYGLHIGRHASARTEVGALGGSTGAQSVLVMYSNADGKDGDTAGGSAGTGKVGATGASLNISGVGATLASASTTSTTNSTASASGPTIATDKPDYMPGDTVTFTGTGFAAGDTVTITVHEDPTWSYPDRQFVSVADANGGFVNRDMVVATQDLGVTFTATAVAVPSGLVAQTVFTDGQGVITGTVTDAVTHNPIAGATVTCPTTGSNPCNSPTPTATTAANGTYGLHVNFPTNGPQDIDLVASATGYITSAALTVNILNKDSLSGRNFALTPAGPTKLAFTTAALMGTVGQCIGPITVQMQNASSTPTNVTSNTTVNLTSDNGATGAGAFYDTNACSSTITSILVASGSNSGSFYYKATARGSGSHALTASSTGLTSASQTETINKILVDLSASVGTLTYNATPQGPTFSGDISQVTINYSGVSPTSYGPSTTQPTDAGSYGWTATLNDPANYDFAPEAATSGSFNIAKATPTFSFNLSSLSAKTFGDADFSVAGASYVTTNSPGAVTFALHTGSVGCTVSAAGLVTITGAATGTDKCAIDATLAESANYLGAGPATQSFNIAKATPTFSFNLSSLPAKTFWDADFSVAGASYVTTNSPGTVTFALHTGSVGCTVSAAGQVTITGAATGTDKCAIDATLAESANYLGAGPATQSFNIAKATPTFSFNLGSLPAKTFGDGTFPVAGASYVTTNSPGMVTFALHTGSVGCTVTAAGQVTLTGAATGTDKCVIDATLAESPNYLGAGPATQSFNIAKATPTINVTGYSVDYDGHAHTATATATGVGGADLIGLLTLTGTTHTNAGTYTADAWSFAGAPNYLDANGTVNDEIKKVQLTVTAPNFTVTYGDLAPSPITPVITGFVNGEGTGALTMQPTCTTTYTPTSNAGSAQTTSCTGGTAANYSFAYAGGTVTVNVKAATVTANDQTKAYGDAFAFSGTEFTPNGLINGDVVNSVTLTSAGAPAAASPLNSPYAIIASNAVGTGLGNYNISYVPGHMVVTNDAPVITSALGPAVPVALGSTVSISGTFTDHGVANDSYTISSTWTSTDGTTAYSGTSTFGGSAGTFAIQPTNVPVGVYTVTIKVTDKWNAESAPWTLTGYVVVFDPSGGFVTGGGWITAPDKSCDPTFAPAGVCTDATGGRANFGFVSKYQKGANVPSGNTEFQFQAGKLNFKSTSYQWLVISGPMAQYKGTGTINGGATSYNFILTAVDGLMPGGGGSDKFRIKITDLAGNVIFDNQVGDLDSATPNTTLGGGDVTIHTK